ncbi:hypothetical protein D3C77_121810 [compost metagenome]
MSQIRWSAQEIGIHGVVMIAADLDMSGPEAPEALLGYRRAVHPFELDEVEDPRQRFASIIKEMTEVMGRASAQPLPASRVRAFTHPCQELQP